MHTIAIGGCRAGHFIGNDAYCEGDTRAEFCMTLLTDRQIRSAMAGDEFSASTSSRRTTYVLRKFTWVDPKKLERTYWFWIDIDLDKGGISFDVWDHIFASYRTIATT